MKLFNITQIEQVEFNKKALKEFRRLRNFYRNHYDAGDNDSCFHTWIEIMIDRDRKDKGQNLMFEEDEF